MTKKIFSDAQTTLQHPKNPQHPQVAPVGLLRYRHITAVTRPCPSGIKNLDGDDEIAECHYLLTIPFNQLDQDPQLFK